jgi:hypothetical protein
MLMEVILLQQIWAASNQKKLMVFETSMPKDQAYIPWTISGIEEMTDQRKPVHSYLSTEFTGTEDVEKDMTCSEDDLIQHSALQHMVFCERKCALMQLLDTASLNATKLGRVVA